MAGSWAKAISCLMSASVWSISLSAWPSSCISGQTQRSTDGSCSTWSVPPLGLTPSPFKSLHLPLVLGMRGGGGGGASGGESELDVSVETRIFKLRLNMRLLEKAFCDCKKRGLMKQRAPWLKPQFSSLGLRVLIGQNSWNRVGFESDLVPFEWGSAALSWFSASGWKTQSGSAARLVCRTGGADVATSGFSSFLGLGGSRGPRTFRWERQNSRKELGSYYSALFSWYNLIYLWIQ